MRFEGRLAPGVTAKDLTLALISRYGSVGGNGYAVEYAGSAVRDMEIEARLTLCNMATEFSAFTGMIAPDQKTFDYLRGRQYAPKGELFERAVAQWRELVTDEGASDIELVDLSQSGAGFVHDGHLEIGKILDLLLPGGVRRKAMVRWSRGNRGGLWLTQPLDRADLESISRFKD